MNKMNIAAIIKCIKTQHLILEYYNIYSFVWKKNGKNCNV